jgi:hypothetical protein
MSTSQFVCWKDGIAITTSRGSWRHALGGRTGAIPHSKRHAPVVISREEYDLCFAPGTPPAVSRAIAARMSQLAARQPGSAEAGLDGTDPAPIQSKQHDYGSLPAATARHAGIDTGESESR